MSRSVDLHLSHADSSQFAEDVAYYLSLTPRQLPSQYLYDDLGSILFEAICRLPWYHVTRVEQELLRTHSDEIFTRVGGLSTVIELGSGSGEKLATLMDASTRGPLTAHLVDVSPNALTAAAKTLHVYGDVAVVPHCATYEAGLADIAADRGSAGRTMALFLGSNIGNFDPPDADAFLQSVRAALTPQDAILLGADLVKPVSELLLAYEDPLGVTAAFNKNLLVRANRELGTDFAIDRFAHRAVWNAEASRIEMHLVSLIPQRVYVPLASLELDFEMGETIWTESSYKYRPADVKAMLSRAGFAPVEQWVLDGFALTLATVR
jgi:L-histidine N-alpha-methyltransferase